jgi:D-glycero-alpha-D-manno-heptose-7-phosphate kinase
MIIARSPLRVSLGGGGTDLPSYYERNGGFLIAAAINKYVYATVNRPFTNGVFLKYSSMESVQEVELIRHPIIREVLKVLNLETPQIEITTLADIPAGTGLGSSGSFTTALIKALYVHYKKSISTYELAELACQIEIEKLKSPIGKQDQYIAAVGGITEFIFNQDGTVITNPLKVSQTTIHDLEDNLLIFFTGVTRSANKILINQDQETKKNENEMIKNLDFVKEIGMKSKQALVDGETRLFGELMHEHWMTKKYRSSGITNSDLDDIYDIALRNGAIGGKIVGAGGGGFFMFYATDREKLQNCMRNQGLEEVRFNFDFEGTKVILS